MKKERKTGILNKVSAGIIYLVVTQSAFAAGGGSAGIWGDLIAWLKQFETGLMMLFITIMVISLIARIAFLAASSKVLEWEVVLTSRLS